MAQCMSVSPALPVSTVLNTVTLPRGYVSMSPDSKSFVVDTITGDFQVYDERMSSPSATLARPTDIVSPELKVKQGAFGENASIIVCGSPDNRMLIYDLSQASPIMPRQSLVINGKGPVQVVAASCKSLYYELKVNADLFNQTFSFADKHILLGSVAEDDPCISVWMRSRTGRQSLPPAQPKAKDLPPGQPAQPAQPAQAQPPPPEGNTVGYIILLVIVLSLFVWYSGWDWVCI